MSINQRVLGDATVIRVDEVLTYRNRKEFSSAVAQFKESASRHLIINLHEATYVDSAAIGLLALTSQQVAADRRQVSLVAPQGTVKQVLELSHIDRMIPMFPTEEAAAGQRPE
jgi:anti-sigma B factor antagonist